MPVRIRIGYLAALAVLLATEAASRVPPEDASSDVLLPREVLNRFYLSDRQLLAVYGSDGTPETEVAYRRGLESSPWSRASSTSLRPANEVKPDDLAGKGVWLLGTPRSNRFLKSLLPHLPIRFEESGFRFAGRLYTDPDDVVQLLWTNPVNPERPLFVATGNRDVAIAATANSPTLQPHHYQISRGGRLLRFGNFALGSGTWRVDPSSDRDFERELRPLPGDKGERIHLLGDAPAEVVERFLSAHRAQLQRVADFFGQSPGDPTPIDVYVYARLVDKGLFTGDERLVHVVAEPPEIHVALEEGMTGESWSGEARLAARRIFGPPTTELLETGLAVHFAGESWRRRGYRYWAARLELAGRVPPLAELLDSGDELYETSPFAGRFEREDLEFRSPLLVEALAGSLVAFLLEIWGRQEFFDRYATWAPEPERLADLDARWRRELAREVEALRERIDRDRGAFPRRHGFQRGFNHTHEALSDPRRGYLSKRSDEALGKLVDLGADAVAIVPYTYHLTQHEPTPLPVLRGAVKENDETVLHAILEAKRRGLSILLKPQLQGVWPGRIGMRSEVEWDRFFAYYETWLDHYALMAEMYDIEILCVGVELVRATEGHEENWTRLVKRIRRLYSGELVYAANWGGELEHVKFWSLFDYIGVNAYYPLSDSDTPTDAELLTRAEKVMDELAAVHRRHGKPVLITEIGYPSAEAPWKDPWEDGFRRPLNLEHQVRCYRTMITALDAHPWLSGVYWWRWLSSGVGGPGHPSYTPRGKPAEELVAKYFKHFEQHPGTTERDRTSVGVDRHH